MMTEINLLPWREFKRDQEKKWFTGILVSGLIAAVFIVFILNCYVTSLIKHQMYRNKRLADDVAVFDKQLAEIKQLKAAREEFISKMFIVQNLQSTRLLTVHLFDELIKVAPKDMFVTRLERKNNSVTVWGVADSNSSISALMRHIEKSEWIRDPILTEIKKPEGRETQKLRFVLATTHSIA